MRELTPAEIRDFLRHGTRTGKLAVVRADGRPMVVPVWFDVEDDGRIVFTVGAETIKARAMRREPRVSICVDDDAPPFGYVRIDGTAELLDDLPSVREVAERVGGRYMGAARAAEFGARNGVPGELLVRITPERTIGRADVAD